MMRSICIALAGFLLACAASDTTAPADDASDLAHAAIELFNSQSFDELSKLFHYASVDGRTEAELSVSEDLASFHRHLGSAEDARTHSDNCTAFTLGAMSPECEDWDLLESAGGEFETVGFHVEYAKAGFGLASVWMYSNGHDWQIRAMMFGLPLTREDWLQYMEPLADELHNLRTTRGQG